jgi:hypothetical protein
VIIYIYIFFIIFIIYILFCILYRKKIYLACTSLLGVETLKRIVFVPNVVFLVHDLPCVFTLKHDMSLKPDTRLPGVQTLKRIVFVPNLVFSCT